MTKWGMQDWLNIQKSVKITHHNNRTQDKNQMTISMDVENASDKFQHPLTKPLNQLGIEGNFLKLTRYIYKENGAIIFNSERLNAFPLKSRKEQDKDVLSPLLIHTV